jgi:hypothetical protein
MADEEKKEKSWEPTDSQLTFAQDVVETNFKNVTESYRKAYPNASAKWASTEAYHLMRNPKIKGLIEQISQDVRAKFTLLAPEALARIEDLAKDADSEKVKLAANLEILDRGGFRAPDKVELSLPGIFGDANPEAIKRMIKDRQVVKEKVKEEMAKSEG